MNEYTNTHEKKIRFLELKRQGVQHKEIIKELGVSMQTLSAWSATLPALLAERAVLAMQRRMLEI